MHYSSMSPYPPAVPSMSWQGHSPCTENRGWLGKRHFYLGKKMLTHAKKRRTEKREEAREKPQFLKIESKPLHCWCLFVRVELLGDETFEFRPIHPIYSRKSLSHPHPMVDTPWVLCCIGGVLQPCSTVAAAVSPPERMTHEIPKTKAYPPHPGRAIWLMRKATHLRVWHRNPRDICDSSPKKEGSSTSPTWPTSIFQAQVRRRAL